MLDPSRHAADIGSFWGGKPRSQGDQCPVQRDKPIEVSKSRLADIETDVIGSKRGNLVYW